MHYVVLHSAVGYGGRDQIIMQFGNYFNGLNNVIIDLYNLMFCFPNEDLIWYLIWMKQFSRVLSQDHIGKTSNIQA